MEKYTIHIQVYNHALVHTYEHARATYLSTVVNTSLSLSLSLCLSLYIFLCIYIEAICTHTMTVYKIYAHVTIHLHVLIERWRVVGRARAIKHAGHVHCHHKLRLRMNGRHRWNAEEHVARHNVCQRSRSLLGCQCDCMKLNFHLLKLLLARGHILRVDAWANTNVRSKQTSVEAYLHQDHDSVCYVEPSTS